MTTAVETVKTRPSLSHESARAFLERALRQGASDRALVCVCVPAPKGDPLSVLSTARKGAATFWRPPASPASVTTGVTHRLSVEGTDRFSAIESWREELAARVRSVCHSRTANLAPRAFGGFAFAPGSAAKEPWTDFGDGQLVLPRWQVDGGAHQSTISTYLDFADGWSGRTQIALAEFDQIWRCLARPQEHDVPRAPAPKLERVGELERGRWEARMREIAHAFEEGRFKKVVAARRSDFCAREDLDPLSVLNRLRAQHPDTYTFGLRFGASTFVGATPECLFQKRGLAIHADALAGSIDAELENAASRLRASHKDRREHRPVVEHLREQLSPLCERIACSPEPEIRRLRNVLHLHTSVRGELSNAVEVGALLRALHPTPAVGGQPRSDAVRWIEEHEEPRGWYAGPVGWIDLAGDADFAVALRCGLIRGPNAWLYAGGGIVPGSDPDSEWDEAQLKLRPMLNAMKLRSSGDPG